MSDTFVPGIDVSDFQGQINWKSVAGAGYGWGSTKATEGTSVVHDTLDENMAGMRADLKGGGCAYHFFRWQEDPIAQAKYYLYKAPPKAGDLVPMLDLEVEAGYPPPYADPAKNIANVAAFNKTVEDALAEMDLALPDGSRALVIQYQSYYFAQEYLGGGSAFAGHPGWGAAYNNDTFESNILPHLVGKKPGMIIWQNTSSAKVPSILGNVDHDLFLGTLADVHKFTLTKTT
jgi:lysozyme